MDWKEQKIINKIGQYDNVISSFDFSPDGNIMIVADEYEDVTLYSTEKLKILHEIKLSDEIVKNVWFENDCVFYVETDFRLHEFKITDHNPTKVITLSKHRNKLQNNNMLDTGSADVDSAYICSRIQYRHKSAANLSQHSDTLFIEYPNEPHRYYVAPFEMGLGSRKGNDCKDNNSSLNKVKNGQSFHVYSALDILIYFGISSLELDNNDQLYFNDNNYMTRFSFNKGVTGSIKYNVRLPSRPAGNPIKINDDYCVSAFSDGTIRWYDMRTGEELLAMFVKKDGDYIMWRPDGKYYTHTPSNSNLLEWQYQNFMNVEVKNSATERSKQFDTKSIYTMLNRIYNKMDNSTDDFPEILIDSIYIQKSKYKVKYSIINCKKSYQLDAMYDNNYDSRYGKNTLMEIIEIDSALVDNEISLILSDPGKQIYDIKTKILDEDRFLPVNNIHYLICGISKYQELEELKSATHDSYDFEDILLSKSLFNDSDGEFNGLVSGNLLANQDVIWDNILNRLEQLENTIQDNDLTIFYYSGHGIIDEQNDQLFLSTYDSKSITINNTEYGIIAQDIIEKISKLKGYKLIIVDACYAGKITSETYENTAIYASSLGTETSQDGRKFSQSFFTKALISILQGYSGNDVSFKSLKVHLEQYIEKLAPNQHIATAIDNNIANKIIIKYEK